MQPTRGLDIGAIEYVHKRLLEQAAAGTAILLVSSELDEILALSDRIAVLRDGKIVGTLPRGRGVCGKDRSPHAGKIRRRREGTLTTAPPIALPADDRLRAIGTGSAIILGALRLPDAAIGDGVNPFLAYWEIFRGAFKSVGTIAETLLYAAPVILTALSVILCFRCGLWNIGADGQLYLGAIAAVAVGFNGLNLPGPLVLPAMFVAAFVAGGFWAFIPAVLRLWAGANEVIVTIMMNFIAVILATYFIGGPGRPGLHRRRARSSPPDSCRPSFLGRGFMPTSSSPSSPLCASQSS